MTAYAYGHLIQEARTEGVLEIFRKPLDINQLLDLVEKTSAARINRTSSNPQ